MLILSPDLILSLNSHLPGCWMSCIMKQSTWIQAVFNSFFSFCWNKVYSVMALSYSAYAIVTLSDHLPCVSGWVCDSALWQQTLVYSSWSVWDAATLGASISSALYIFLMLSLKMTWMRCLNSRWQWKPWSSTTEMSWLSRVINSVAFSGIFSAMSLFHGQVFYMPYQFFCIKCSSFVTPPHSGCTADVTCCCWTNLKYFHSADIWSTDLPE